MKNLFWVLLMPLSVFAQGTYSPQGGGKLKKGYDMNCIFPLNDNEVWCLASNDGSDRVKLCKTTNGGNTWNVSDIDTGLSGYGVDLFVQNSNIAYATAIDNEDGMVLYKTQNGGLFWYRIPGNESTFIHMFNSTEGASLMEEKCSYTTDSFHTETVLLAGDPGGPPFGERQHFMSGVNSKCVTDSGLFFIYPKGYVVRTQNKGKTWKGLLAGLNNTSAICGIAASGNMLMAVQWETPGKVTKGLSRSFDGGNTWQDISSSLPSNLVRPLIIASVPGQSGHFILTDYALLYHSIDSGITWLNLNPPDSISKNATGAFMMSSTNIGWYGMSVNNDSAYIITKCIFNFQSASSVKPNRSGIDKLIFPNPASDKVNVPVPSETRYVLFNSLGQQVQKGYLTAGNTELNVSGFEGLFYLHLQDNSGTSVHKLLVKRN